MADGLEWSFDEVGTDDLESFFEYAGYKARDMRAPLSDTADYISFTVLAQFESEGAFRSGGWLPLDEDYEEWKLVKGGGDMILQLTPALLHGEPGDPRDDYMMNTLLNPISWTVTSHDAIWHPDSDRAAWNHMGAVDRRRGGTLPSRPILDLNETDYEFIEDIFYEWLDELRTANPARGDVGEAEPPGIFG